MVQKEAEQLYDRVAERYQMSKQLPFRQLEMNHFLSCVGDLHGLCVVDLACGEGFYTRLLAAEASSVVGVDISARMIELANRKKTAVPASTATTTMTTMTMTTNVEYLQADVAKLVTEEPYASQLATALHGKRPDLVCAAYLLNYARDRQELAGFVRTIYRIIQDGGRFVTVNDNPMDDPSAYETSGYAALGMWKSVAASGGGAATTTTSSSKDITDGSKEQRREGDAITYTFATPDPSTGTTTPGPSACTITNYWIPPDVIEECFLAEGFCSFRWLPVVPDAAAPSEQGPKWSGFLRNCPLICMEAIK